MATGAYRYHVRTKDGRTPEDPCGTFCWEPDVASWKEVVEGIESRLLRAWAKLQQLNPEAAAQIPIEEWRLEVETIPSWWDIWVGGFGGLDQNRNVVDSIIGIAETGADLLEDVQDQLGTEALPLGKPHSSGSIWDSFAALVIGAGVVAGLGALVFYGVKQKRSALREGSQ